MQTKQLILRLSCLVPILFSTCKSTKLPDDHSSISAMNMDPDKAQPFNATNYERNHSGSPHRNAEARQRNIPPKDANNAGNTTGILLKQWKHSYGRNVVVKNGIGVAGSHKAVVGFEAASGGELWRFDRSRRSSGFKPCFLPPGCSIYNNEVIFGTCAGEVISLHLHSGRVKWRLDFRKGPNPFLGPLDLSPTIVGGTLIVGSRWHSLLIGIDIKTLGEKWRRNVSTNIDPLVHNNKIVVTTNTEMTVILPESGKVSWHKRFYIVSSGLYQDRAFICNDFGVFVFELSSGRKEKALKVACGRQLVFHNNTFYTFTDNEIRSYKIDGELRWKFSNQHTEGIAVYDSRLFFGSWSEVGILESHSGRKINSVPVIGYNRISVPIPYPGYVFVSFLDELHAYTYRGY